MNVPSRSGQLPMVPQNGTIGISTPGTSVVVEPPRRSNVRTKPSGKLLGQQAELGQDGAPAPVARLQREDLDGQRVARIGALDAHRPRQVVERVEVEFALLERRALLHLAIAGHEQVEVHDVAGLDGQRGRELAIPGVVVDGRVEDVLGHAQVPSSFEVLAE